MTYSFALAGSHSAAAPFFARLQSAGSGARALSPHLGATPAEVANRTGLRTLFLIPRDVLDSERLLFEVEDFARTSPELELILLSGPLSPRYTRALRARIPAHVALVDAPFSGSLRQIEAGQATFLLGGASESVRRCQPILTALGQTTTHMGEFGTAMAAKALYDCISAASSALTRSALDWADAQGIEETRLIHLLETSFGRRMLNSITDPASLVTNTLPGDNAGQILVKNVEQAMDMALKGVHLTPPRRTDYAFSTTRARHIH
ncbi:MAG: NAD(P)-binding domain-containing protein [Rhodobacteraceae bacterium]|nr:NAD(P)-binding domain-containing protein [Paracoccaceae bacterium]